MLFKIYGSKWSKIAVEFPGMSENDIKNKFYSSLKSIANRLEGQQSPLKHKDELVRFVDIAIIYDNLLPCNGKSGSKRGGVRGLKRRRGRTGDLEEAGEKREGAKSKETKIAVWPVSKISEANVFSDAISRMVWEQTKPNHVDTCCPPGKTLESLSRDEIKSNP